MARKKIPDDESPRRVTDMPLERIADLASAGAVRLLMTEQPCQPLDIWRVIRGPNDPTALSKSAKAAIESGQFKQLLDIRLRRATLSVVEETHFLRDLCGTISKLAGSSVLEDFLTHPESINIEQKRLIAKDFGGLYDSLTAKRPPAGVPAQAEPAETPEAASVGQATEMDEALERIPAVLRSRAVRQWKLREVNAINETEQRLLSGGQTPS